MSAFHPSALDSKRILVTGASSGIGRAIAVECSRVGAELIITGRDEIQINHTLKILHGYGHKSIIADVNNFESMEKLTDEVTKLDGIVLCAGINKRQIWQYAKPKDVDLILQTNLIGPMMLLRGLLKKRKVQNGASVVFISSIAAFHSSIGEGAYSATKGGLSSFSKTLALEQASRKVRVNTIQPGMVKTAFWNNSPLSDEDYLKDEARYPLGRYGQPEDIAYASVFLLSDASAWITGTDMIIDGGISLV